MNEKEWRKLFDEAKRLSEEGKWEASIAKWDEVIPWLPDGNDKAFAYDECGVAKCRMGNYKGAIKDHDYVLAGKPWGDLSLVSEVIDNMSAPGVIIDFRDLNEHCQEKTGMGCFEMLWKAHVADESLEHTVAEHRRGIAKKLLAATKKKQQKRAEQRKRMVEFLTIIIVGALSSILTSVLSEAATILPYFPFGK